MAALDATSTHSDGCSDGSLQTPQLRGVAVTEIRSYRSVFDLERRIYRIDRLRLNPNGVPLRGVAYFLAGFAIALIAAALPALGALAHAIPWYIRQLALPSASAAVFALIRIEGRTFHLAVLGLLRYAVGPRELAGLRPRRRADECWRLAELVILADGSDARLRRMRYAGPGAVLIRTAHTRTVWRVGPVGRLARRPQVTLSGLRESSSPARGQVIALSEGTSLEVRP